MKAVVSILCTLATIVGICSLVAHSAAAGPPTMSIGKGADRVWIIRPTGAAKSIVVFGHGWSTPTPSGFGGWIAHLRARGNIVVYPRYRVSAGDAPAQALSSFRRGVVAAFRQLRHAKLPVIALGKSFGGAAVFDYASAAAAWGVPAPAAVVSIFPAYPIGGLPPAPLPRNIFVQLEVGDADTTAGSGGADAFWRWLAGHPATKKRYVVIHSRSGFVANHDSAQRTDPIARAVFWRPFDVIVDRVRARR